MPHILTLNNFNFNGWQFYKQKEAPSVLLQPLHTRPSTWTNFKTRSSTLKSRMTSEFMRDKLLTYSSFTLVEMQNWTFSKPTYIGCTTQLNLTMKNQHNCIFRYYSKYWQEQTTTNNTTHNYLLYRSYLEHLKGSFPNSLITWLRRINTVMKLKRQSVKLKLQVSVRS